MDLSRDDEGATQDRSNAPITTPHDPEQVDHHTSSDIIITIAAIFSTPCYKQFLLGLEEPEKNADAEKSEILR